MPQIRRRPSDFNINRQIASPTSRLSSYRFQVGMTMVGNWKKEKPILVWDNDEDLPSIGFEYTAEFIKNSSHASLSDLLARIENCDNVKLIGLAVAAGHYRDHGEQVDGYALRIWVEKPWTLKDICKRINLHFCEE